MSCDGSKCDSRFSNLSTDKGEARDAVGQPLTDSRFCCKLSIFFFSFFISCVILYSVMHMSVQVLRKNQLLYYVDKQTGKVGSIRVDSISGNSFSFMLHGKSHTLNTEVIGERLFFNLKEANSRRPNSATPIPATRCVIYTGPAYGDMPASIYEAVVYPPLDTRPYERLLDRPLVDDWRERSHDADDDDEW